MSYSYAEDSRFPGPDPYRPLRSLPEFPLRSDTFADGAELPEPLRAPESVSPQLSWSGLPEGTKSLAITCFDPDAPTGSGFWHWAAFNIPASVASIQEGAGSRADLGIDGVISLAGDSGEKGFYGPQPPAGHGPHRYLFAVHAVDVERLDIDPGATATVLGFNLYFHSIGRAVLWGWAQTVPEA